MSRDRSVVIRIEGNSKALRDEYKRVKSQTENLDKNLRSIVKGSSVAFAGLATTVGLTVKAFATYEDGLLGVGKTADLTGKELTDFGKEIQKLSTRLPFTTRELLAISQSAGQLGVKGRKNLIKFTETIAKLGTASDLSGEVAATALTRILNVTGESISTIDKFASVIVSLGNNFAATESEIARMATEVSRSTSVYGVSAAEAAALGAALKSVGIQAEGGGSAVGRAFRAIDASVRGGGESFEDLQRITGLTGEQLKKTFEEDSVAVFQKFTEGLGDVVKSGGDVTQTLAAFGLRGDEILKVLPVLAGNSELLGRALATAARETANATALNKEFEVQAKSLNAEVSKLKGTIISISEQIGSFFSPSVKEAIKSLREFLSGFLNLDEGTKKTTATILGILTVMTGLIATVAAVGLGLSVVVAGLTAVGITAAPVIAGFIGISAIAATIITQFDALSATVTGIQAGFQLLVSKIIVGFNNAKIATNELAISMKELTVAALEAIPGQLLIGRIKALKESIRSLEEVNEGLINNNNDITRSFEEIYDAIDAEKMREKILAEGQAAREAREANKVAELERQTRENEEKLLQDQEYKDKLQAQNIAAKDAVLALKDLEVQLLEATQQKFNKAEIVNIRKQIADKAKLLTKGYTDEQKELFRHLLQKQKAELEDEKARLEFKKKFQEDTLDSAVSLGKGLVKEGTAAQKALFLVEKAGALASAVMNTAQAVSLALANPPGPPFNAPQVAAAAAMGALQVASIASTAIGLEKGGMVGAMGTSRPGDRHPAMLSDGELVVPRKNFEEVVAATARQRGFVDSNSDDQENVAISRIEIGFTDEAAEMITAKQLENTILGTDRG